MLSPRLFCVDNCRDDRGALCFLEKKNGLPFDVKRIYYITDVPDQRVRGAHGHYTLEQVIIALTGSVKIQLHGRYGYFECVLDDPTKALYVPPMSWRELKDFSINSAVLVLASEVFNADDYSYDKSEFL